MRNKKKYGYLAKNTILFSISSFGSKILTFLLVPLYTSVLTTSEYGIADIITTSVMLMGYIFTLNISDAVLRFAIEDKDPKRILAYSIRVLCIGSIIVALSLLVVNKAHIISWPSYCFGYMVLYYFGLQLSSLLNNYLRAIDKVKYVAVSGIITTMFTIFSNIIFLLLFKFRLSGYLLSMVIGVFGTSLFQLAVLKFPLRNYFILHCDKNLKKEMLLYSVPLIFNGVAWWINSSLDKYFITYLIGIEAAGIYAVAYKIPTLLTMVQSIFNQAWNLSAIREYNKNDEDGFFSKTYTIYNVGLVLACSILLIINIPMARILFAKDFFEAWHYAPLLLISTLFSTMSGFIGSVFSAVKNSKVYAVSTISSAIINTILNIMLISQYGISGAAIATVISFFFVWVIRLVCSRKYIVWHVNFKKDLMVYVILIGQAVCAILYEKQYILQCVFFFVLLVLCFKTVKDIFIMLLNRVRRK